MHLPSNVSRALDKTLSDLRVDYLDVRVIRRVPSDAPSSI